MTYKPVFHTYSAILNNSFYAIVNNFVIVFLS